MRKISARNKQKNISNMEHKVNINDKIRGSLIAGAMGDALGYEVEFMHRNAILAEYGEKGITKLALDERGKTQISDDTQMTLFTAAGMLMGITRGYMRGIGGRPEYYVTDAYKDWYYTQQRTAPENYHNHTWLFHIKELYSRRAPGLTCLHACEDIIAGREVRNNSKGCGGIMRVAPMPLLLASCACAGHCPYDLEEMAVACAEVASCTHKHPLGFLPAALLGIFLYKIAFLNATQVKEQIELLVADSLQIIDNIYKDDFIKHKKYLRQLTEKALKLAFSSVADADAIAELGEGWVAEETWAVALFCAVRHINSPEQAIIASVNHDGDSDSTGSVTGNIMGAIYGYNYIKERNLLCPEGCEIEQTLELANIILTIADDLTTSCIINEYDYHDTTEKQQWFDRYCEHLPAGV